MNSGKQFMQQASCSATTVQSSSAADATHDAFLQIRLEPPLSTSLMELLDILVYPTILSPSLPNTPPPIYEPPPPSYPSSEAWSVASMSTLSLSQLNDALNNLGDTDSMSIFTNDMYFDDSNNYDSGFGSSTASMGSGGASSSGNYANGQPELQNQLVLSLLVYELLTHQSALSRSSSRGSFMTSSSDF
ncbi:hypothetical protein J3B02_002617 [Coemansia erecta]|uniref:Uncharacterized protein n=1 Tax=Coemansia asiatica TaxID=1052880 RepID=A0A9W8CJ84_9FUNG|nr:hypothetical protein LPJ64_002309 [Coemansia asiatica]KAJ2854557.1 hypothetical protein J3B02_002617 [Coemansia erecta]KAJ2874795.1 hypothetical protein FB639_004065 [Coemansia asiatica]